MDENNSSEFSEIIVIKNKTRPKYTNKAEKFIKFLFLLIPLLKIKNCNNKVSNKDTTSIKFKPI